MNKTDLIARTAERLQGDRAAAAAAADAVLDEIAGGVARGERVSLTGFGTFDRRERAARTGRNPRTGESIQLGPSVVPVFRPGTRFRSLVTVEDGAAVAGTSVVPPAEPGPSVQAEAVDGGKTASRSGKGSKKSRKGSKNKSMKSAAGAS